MARTLLTLLLPLVVTLPIGCADLEMEASRDDESREDDAVGLSPPERGFQIENLGTVIEPGEDVEYCEIVELPGTPADTYYVDRFESEMTQGSHHLIVTAIEVGSETDANTRAGDRVKCFGPNVYGEDMVDVIGQQTPYYEETFPAGVGRVYSGGQKLVFNYHYLNATEVPLPARARINFHTVDEAAIDRIAKVAAFLYVGIDVEPGASASYPIGCTFDTDVMVHKLARHTHRWGLDFPVEYLGGDQDGELIYNSPDYEEPDYVFPEPARIAAGDGFRFTCNYYNSSDHRLRFGPTTEDEMCILFATVYSPVDRELSDQGCLGVPEP